MRILVVEDEKALSDALCEILKRDKEINLLEERINKLENLIQKVGV